MLLLWASTMPPHPPPREPMPPPPRPPTRRAAANLGPVKEEKKAIPAAAMSYKAWDLSDNEAAPAMSLGHPAQQNAALLVLHQFQEDQHCKKKEKEKENNATVAVMVKYLVCCFRRSTKHYYIVLEFAAGTGNVRQGQIPPDLALIEVIIRVLAVQHAGSARWQDVQTKPSFLFSLLYNVLLSLYEIEGPYKSVILDCHYGLLLV